MDIDKVFKSLVKAASENELALLSSLIYEEKKRRVHVAIDNGEMPIPSKAEILDIRHGGSCIAAIKTYRERNNVDIATAKEVMDYWRVAPQGLVDRTFSADARFGG